MCQTLNLFEFLYCGQKNEEPCEKNLWNPWASLLKGEGDKIHSYTRARWIESFVWLGKGQYDMAFKNINFNLIYISEKKFNNKSDIPFLLK